MGNKMRPWLLGLEVKIKVKMHKYHDISQPVRCQGHGANVLNHNVLQIFVLDIYVMGFKDKM